MNTDLEALLRDAGRTPPASGVDVHRAVARGRTVRRRRRLAAAAGAAVALVAGVTLALTGLPLVDRGPVPGGTLASTGADPVQTQLSGTLMQALVHGKVQREGDCLVLDRGNDRTVVVWPPGTRWSAGDEVVVLADGLRVGLGDEVTGSGGYLAADRTSLNRLLGAAPADRAIRCAQSLGRSVVLINHVSRS
jgi:hypothetical protein